MSNRRIYYHGRSDGRRPAETGWPVFCAADPAVAEAYAGASGVVYSVTIDDTIPSADDSAWLQQIAAALAEDYAAGTLPVALDKYIAAYNEDVAAMLSAEVSLDNIVSSGGLWDTREFAGWLYDRFGVTAVSVGHGAYAGIIIIDAAVYNFQTSARPPAL